MAHNYYCPGETVDSANAKTLIRPINRLMSVLNLQWFYELGSVAE